MYFPKDIDGSGEQFLVGGYATFTAAEYPTVSVDPDWFTFEGGSGWIAPRDCTLTKISASCKINFGTTTGVRVWVLKGAPHDILWSENIDATAIGHAVLHEGGARMTDYSLYHTSTTITGSNTVSDKDSIIIGWQALGGDTTSSGTPMMSVTLEFTEA